MSRKALENTNEMALPPGHPIILLKYDRRIGKKVHREKSLRHVAMVAKFLDDNKPKIHLKGKFALFQTSSILFSFI